jgi:hypothetical protein
MQQKISMMNFEVNSNTTILPIRFSLFIECNNLNSLTINPVTQQASESIIYHLNRWLTADKRVGIMINICNRLEVFIFSIRFEIDILYRKELIVKNFYEIFHVNLI